MKRIILLFALLGPVLLNAQTNASAHEHMKVIGDHAKRIQEEFWDYTSAVAHGKSARKVESKRDELVKTVKDAKRQIGVMKPYQGDSKLKDSVVAFLDLTYKVLTHDYDKILDMEAVAEQSYDAMEAYLLAQDLAGEKLRNASASLQEVEKEFAEKHGINLVEDNSELAKKIEIAGEVNDYYRQVFLIFFKSFKQEAYLLEAIGRKDLSGMEQNRSSLGKYAAEGISSLGDIKSFKGDPSLITACKQMLQFYEKECSNEMAVISSYFLKEEEFAKAQKAIEAKGSQRTKADIDSYNKAVAEMNKASAEYNTAVNTLNANRAKLLENWNKTTTAFLHKHTPPKRGKG